jgi:hypothetical protein
MKFLRVMADDKLQYENSYAVMFCRPSTTVNVSITWHMDLIVCHFLSAFAEALPDVTCAV